MAKVSNYKAFLAAGAAFALALAASPAQAQQRTFDLPAQSATRSIPEFGRQAGIQIIAPGGILRSVRTPALRGTHDVRAALRRLLAGSGLRIVADEGGTITLGVLGAAPSSGEAEAGSAPADDEGVEQEVVVTGTHIRRPGNLAAPSVVTTREDIDRAGFTSTQDLFEALPQNFGGLSPDGRLARGGSRVATQNVWQATGVDLRGLGPESTLTLVNGTRRAGSVGGRVVDVSMIPISLIDRVEIVTGGRSAIYGSDAVAGVANIITRRSFDGFESRIAYTTAASGGEALRLSQTAGLNFGRGSIVGAYDYERDWSLDLVRTGLVDAATPTGDRPLRLTIVPRGERHSFFSAAQFDLTDHVRLLFDGQVATRSFNSVNRTILAGATNPSFDQTGSSTDVYSGSLSLQADLPFGWRLGVSGAISNVKNDQDVESRFDFGDFAFDDAFQQSEEAGLRTASVVLDGPLPFFAGMDARAAIGVEHREEDFTRTFNGQQLDDDHRSVESAFAEVQLGLISNGPVGARSLNLSAAVRYDSYSDFGDALNPQVGIVWEPVANLRVKGAYSRAFRAPTLVEIGTSNIVELVNRSDPLRGGASSPVLQWRGDNSAIGPESAESWTASLEYAPTAWLRMSVDYFNIDYKDRIDVPAQATADQVLVLQRGDRFVGLITRAPTPEQVTAILASDSDGRIPNGTGRPWNPAVQNIFAVFPDLIVFDNRTNNIAVEAVEGIDAAIRTSIDRNGSRWYAGMNGTLTFNHRRSITGTSPAFSLLDEVGKPVSFRLRGSFGWSRGAFGAFANVNYVDSYRDPFVVPSGTIESWTTVDLTLRFDTQGLPGRTSRGNVSASVAIANLFDADPPLFLHSTSGLRYDSSNASPLGRRVTFQLTTRW